MELVDVIGMAGFLLTLILLLSPIPSLYEGVKKMELKNLTLEYILIGACQGCLWFIYGYKLNDYYTTLTNTVMVILFGIYMNIFFYINRMKEKFLTYNAGLILTFSLFCLLLSGTVCLILASILSTVWQFSMVGKIKEALYSKDASFINIQIAYASLCVFLFWTIYSLLINNYLMTVPNTIGVIIWSFNIVLFYWANGFISDKSKLGIFLNSFKSKSDSEGNPNKEPLFTLKTSTGSHGGKL